jgi:serine/threonine-protein kinase Chk1
LKGVKEQFLPSTRLTRYFSQHSLKELHGAISSALDDLVAKYLTVKSLHANGTHLTFSKVDRRRCPLLGDIRIQSVQSNKIWMVLFIRRKGDPLEFKRFYKSMVSHENVAPTILTRQVPESQDADSAKEFNFSDEL